MEGSVTLTSGTGIAVVLVPVTLGVTVLTRSLLRFHGPLYVVGGLVLLALAILAVTGKTWTLPMMRSAPDVGRTDTAGVFVLGVFSGAASACCAPVLAGVVTLSAVSPSLLQGAGLGVTYVFGMVFPLVILTAMWDRFDIGNRQGLRGRTVEWNLASRTFATNTLDLIAAAMFSIMGLVLILVGVTGATVATDFQVDLSLWISNKLKPFVAWLDPVPDLVVGLALVAIGIAAATASGRARKANTTTPRSEDDETESAIEHCH